jgi:hypothetical protein
MLTFRPLPSLSLLQAQALSSAAFTLGGGSSHRSSIIGKVPLPLPDVLRPRLTCSKLLLNKGDELSPTEIITAQPQISERLRRKQIELLSNVPSLSDDRDLTAEEIVREALLSTRLPNLNLNRSRLDSSTIPGAGVGLFATENIANGDVITCYPGDALLYGRPDDCLDGQNDGDEDHDEDEDWIDEVVLWGSHIRVADRWDDNAVFGGIDVGNEEATPSRPPLVDYAVCVCDTYSVLGMPTLDTDPAYFGHFANDGRNLLEFDASAGIERGIAAYVLESVEASNAMHRSLDELQSHMVTIATRDIEAGEEVLVTYGPDYWMEHASV